MKNGEVGTYFHISSLTCDSAAGEVIDRRRRIRSDNKVLFVFILILLYKNDQIG